MFCNQCGKQIPDEAMFCPACGAKTDSLVKEAGGAKKEPKKKKGFPFKIVVPAAGVAVIAVVLVVVILALGGRGVTAIRYNAENRIFYQSASNCFYNLQGETYEFEDYLDIVRSNMDGSIYVCTQYNDSGDGYMCYDLYYIDKELDPVLVEEDVHFVCQISSNGDYIAYMKDVKDDMAGDLYLYSVKDKKRTMIDTDVYPYTYCLSPSGTAVAYIKDYESENDNELWLGGIKIDCQKVDKDGCQPIGVKDNGKELYYVTDNYKLYLYNGKDSEKISSDVSYHSFYLNSDNSEILFVKDGKTYFYTSKMEEPAKVCSGACGWVVTPADVAYTWGTNYESTIYGLDTLKGCVMDTDSGLYWLNESGTDTVKIADSYVYEYQISEDGKSFAYIQNGEVYKISRLNEEMEAKLVHDSDTDYVDYFVASGDLSKIYVVCDDELYYVKNSKKMERITNDLSSTYDVVYNDAMGKVCFLENDTLCYAGTTAKSKEKVIEDAYEIRRIINGVGCVAEEGDDESAAYYLESKEPVKLGVEWFD